MTMNYCRAMEALGELILTELWSSHKRLNTCHIASTVACVHRTTCMSGLVIPLGYCILDAA